MSGHVYTCLPSIFFIFLKIKRKIEILEMSTFLTITIRKIETHEKPLNYDFVEGIYSSYSKQRSFTL